MKILEREIENLREWLNSTTKIKYVIPAYMMLAGTTILGFVTFDALAEQRADDLADFTRNLAYTQCVARVDTRDSLRDILLGITALFEDSESATLIENLIERDYSDMNIADDCADYQPVEGP